MSSSTSTAYGPPTAASGITTPALSIAASTADYASMAPTPPDGSPHRNGDDRDVNKQDGMDSDAPVRVDGESAQAAMEERGTINDESEEERDVRLRKLMYLLQQSQAYSRIMGEKIQRENEERAAKAARMERAARRALDEEAGADGAAKEQVKAEGRTLRHRNRNEEAGGNGKRPERRTGETRKRKGEEDYELGELIGQEDLDGVATQARSSSPSKRSKSDGGAKSQGEQGAAERGATDGETDDAQPKQPALVTGATLRDYQLAGVEWLKGLWMNGLNGILADEMGLGKTLQTIAFLAHMREKRVWGPFLVVAPLSTIANWCNEFERFTPTIPVLLYHGSKDERAALRDERMQLPHDLSKTRPGPRSSLSGSNKRAKKSPSHSDFRKPSSSSDVRQIGTNTVDTFPVIVTSYEVVMRDRAFLAKYNWKFVVVDEGHRLKNMDCKLIRELKTYPSANRLILTGTPLHNNLKELWSLLNFILPDIFDDLSSFERWFDFSDLTDESGHQKLLSERTNTQIITMLHDILKPFMLRRVKTDVETTLPPKKEYLLYAPLTAQQKDLYNAVLGHDIRRYLISKKSGVAKDDLSDSEGIGIAASPRPRAEAVKGNGRGRGQDDAGGAVAGDGDGEPLSSISSRTRGSKRTSPRKSYAVDVESDRKYFRRLEEEKDVVAIPQLTSEEVERQGREWQLSRARKSVYNMHLENVVMQLRKICCHPFLFDWPNDPETGELVVNEDLINASGKMLLLNRLLDALFADDHKVLVFSQFTTVLDIIEDWATEYKGWSACRIDGTTKQKDRQAQMKSFNEDKGPACRLFLLSTRAGGLGINLTGADTVIFFDSDWNPQMDLQAQDRAHRIGQTKPVLIFRLVSANTVEQKILQRADNKRRLEALVIQQSKFKLAPGASADGLLGGGKRSKQESLEEMAQNLLRLEGEKVQLATKDSEIISDENLAKLLDRSPEAFARRTGWMSSVEGREGAAAGAQPAFEVTETRPDETNDALAGMMNGRKDV